MGIDRNPRQDGTKRPRRLRGNSSASRVGSSGTLVGSSGTLVGSSTSRNGTIHVLLGIHLQANTYLNTQSPAYIHIYFWEYTSREIRVIDTITGNSQTHIHSHRLTYIFWERPSR
ncbi:hypothetical protein DPMN_093042 [Dreissena polymorpha]|uniref:Uncharacterized protein n=1 Tax=Dreissena polymorpha TaxID=45954 RepID=A0A9D4R1F6_DREPO|nr:hypothetical protein DPMN_093042 [Dreissena polymorpha]